MTADRAGPIAAAFAREAIRGAFLLNGASLIALPLAVAALSEPGLAPIPRAAIVLAGASFGIGAAFAGLFAFVGYLYYRALDRPTREGDAPGTATDRDGPGALLAAGIVAGFAAYLAFLSGWIFLGDGILATVR